MQTNSPQSEGPVYGSSVPPNKGGRHTSGSPITPPSKLDFNAPNKSSPLTKKKSKFIQGLTSLFGFRKKKVNKASSMDNLEFIQLDAESDLRIAQGKEGRAFKSKLSGKLEELFDSWLNDTAQTHAAALDRQKRISELQYAVDNNAFLSQAASLYADEACQAIDMNGKLIQIECADPRMQERMEGLLQQWGITQNRLRSAAYNLAVFGDAFWANKVTPNGVVRCTPLLIHQIKERLEFNPVQVESAKEQMKGYITALNRNEKLKMLFDTIESDVNEDYSDLFDTKLFGFAMAGEMVVAPWVITHFRLNTDQSIFYPMGESVFLRCLAPFRQYSATQVLQSLARVKAFPVTTYEVTTHPGMDEVQQFEKVNDVREQYENIGDSSVGSEAYSVNTSMWLPKGSLEVKMHSPQIDIKSVEDMQLYLDQIAIASGIPKSYLIQEYGGDGNSAISLVEQFKPFARKVYTVQSAILEGLTNLYRLHFAITGEFDYRADFVLSMKFPNEESSSARHQAKQDSLDLSGSVMDMVSNLIGAINDPLPPEVIHDILKKFSFLDPNDIKKWIKPNPNQSADEDEENPDEFGDEMGGMGGDLGGGGMPPPGMDDLGDIEGEGMGDQQGPPSDLESLTPSTPPSAGFQGPTREQYLKQERKIALQERKKRMLERYEEGKQVIYERVLQVFSEVDEANVNNRHFKSSRIEPCNLPMYELLSKGSRPQGNKLQEESSEDHMTSLADILQEGTAIFIEKDKAEQEREAQKQQEEADSQVQENIRNLLRHHPFNGQIALKE